MVNAPTAGPIVVAYRDKVTGDINNRITPNSGGFLNGDRLTFNEDDPEEGIFFVGEAGTAVRVAQTLAIGGRELTFLVPALTAGAYRVEVRQKTKTKLRAGLLDADLIVE